MFKCQSQVVLTVYVVIDFCGRCDNLARYENTYYDVCCMGRARREDARKTPHKSAQKADSAGRCGKQG